MTHFLTTTLVVTLVVFLVSIWVLEAKIAEEVSELLYKNIKLSAILKTMEAHHVLFKRIDDPFFYYSV